MITRRPRPAASRASLTILSTVRCADTTPTSYATSNSSSACAAACIVGQSESLPMMMPTFGSGCVIAGSFMQPPSGARSRGADARQVGTERRDVADLAARAHRLAVEVHLPARFGRHHVVQPLVDRHATVGAAEHVGHDDDRRGEAGVAERI